MAKNIDQTYYNFLTGAWVLPYDWQEKIRKGNYYETVSYTHLTLPTSDLM